MSGSGRKMIGTAAAIERTVLAFIVAVLLWAPGPVLAQTAGQEADSIPLSDYAELIWSVLRREEMLALAPILGIIFFAVTVAIMLVRTRRRLNESEQRSAEALGDMKARVERAEGLLAADQQVLVIWDTIGDTADIRCDPGSSRDLPHKPADVLAFGKWLAPDSAGELDHLVEALRSEGESFNVMLQTRSGGYVEADGRTAGARTVLRLRDLAGQRRELAEIYHRHKRLRREIDSMRRLLDGLPMPAWMRDANGALSWVNPAYAEAVGATDVDAAVAASEDLLDADARRNLEESQDSEDCAHRRLSVVLAGKRRMLDVFEAPASLGSAGIAIDVTEVEDARRELDRRQDAHGRTLDKVTTGVAVFDPDYRLAFHNAAFRALWGLDETFLQAQPDYGEILDHLRAQGRLPEQADYRAWRARQLEALPVPSSRGDADLESAFQDLWHLPDGRILRVMHAAHPDGGVGHLYEDVTKTLDLESRFVALTRVQRETLDSLDEGIAVFGSDGRLKLHNPGFASMWRLAPDALGGEPHVDEIVGWCRALYDDEAVWRSLSTAVTGLADSRVSAAVRLDRPDGTIIELRILPLPDGATLAVFTDISDSAKIEKALRDRNEALMAAARIKNEFVHKVSYELRAPLTNIIGFAQLISEEATGPLNERQLEYTGYILNSSGALLAIINDILDLATVDAGVMELDVGNVDIRDAVQSAADAIRDRTAERGVTLDIDVPEGIGSFEADEKRVRQILFNLLSNAVGFSEAGQTVGLQTRREGGSIVFAVSDEGPGIPENVRRSVFERFESHALGTRHRGVGLGLSIVKSFVDLHGGRVELDSEPGRGTTLTCIFPATHKPAVEVADHETDDTVARIAGAPRPQDDASPATDFGGRTEAR
jgi:signal transduction histidine kinase